MRISITLAAIAASAILSLGTAAAKPLTVWDQVAGKFITVDPEAPQYASRSYTPIPRQTVRYDGPYGPNTIIIKTSERRLYYVFEDGRAYKYGIGVGRDGFTWSGADRISRKAEWPGWTPPPQMIAREAAKGRKLPAYMPGGINNPLGARAMYIGARIYRIHGSNEPWTIGHAVSSGCIRMTNDDVVDLYEKVNVGTKVVVLQ